MSKKRMNEPKGSQTNKAPPSMEGIHFADEPEPADPRAIAEPAKETTARTAAMDGLNQAAARAAIERMNHHALQSDAAPPPPAKLSAEDEARIKPKVFQVVADHKITRGAASYTLHAGKFVTDRDYDIASLQAQGVQLKAIDLA